MNKMQALALITSTKKIIVSTGTLTSRTLYPTLKVYAEKRSEIMGLFPEIAELLPGIKPPKILEEPPHYIKKVDFDSAVSINNEIDSFLEIWTTVNSANTSISPRPKRIFISHGWREDWRKVQEYIEKVQEIPTLELAQEANRGRTVFQKLIDESDQCGYAVIVMTGDDLTNDEQIRARENVIHEIGYFQGKYGPDRVCLLHEHGVNIPSNIHGLVYIPFPREGIEAALGGLTRELKHL